MLGGAQGNQARDAKRSKSSFLYDYVQYFRDTLGHVFTLQEMQAGAAQVDLSRGLRTINPLLT